jgi:hypothetical protein
MERKYLIAAAVVGLLLLLGLAWRAHSAKKEGLALGHKKRVRFDPKVSVAGAPPLPPLVSPLDPVALEAGFNHTIVSTVNKI